MSPDTLAANRKTSCDGTHGFDEDGRAGGVNGAKGASTNAAGAASLRASHVQAQPAPLREVACQHLLSPALTGEQAAGLDVAKTTKILFVNRSYWPDVEATGQLLTELCESLAERSDYDVSVLCGRANFVAADVEYKARGRQDRNGVTIKRVPHTRFDKKRFWRRIINFLTFCVSAFLSLLFGKRPDIIVCETDPPISTIAAFLISRIRRTKYICYLQDIYPDIAVACGKVKEGFVVKVLRRMLVECYKRADRVVVLSEDMRSWLDTHHVDAQKVVVIQNWVDPDRIYPIKKDNPFRVAQGLDDKFVVMYSGNIGQTQRFDTVLQAARLLRDEQDIVFAFVGDGVKLKSLQNEVESSGLTNVRFYDYQPLDQLAASLSAADIQLILLEQNMTQLMMPSKLYSGLASGTPLLGIGCTDSQLAKIIVDNDCGWFFDCNDAQGIASHIKLASTQRAEHERMGHNARQEAVERHTRGVALAQFNRLFSEL